MIKCKPFLQIQKKWHKETLDHLLQLIGPATQEQDTYFQTSNTKENCWPHCIYFFFIVMDKGKLRNTLCWYRHTVYIYIYIYFFFAEMNSVIQKATNIKSYYFIVSTTTFRSAAALGLQWLLSIISRHPIWFNKYFKWLSYRGFLVSVNKFLSISLPWNLLTMHSFNTKNVCS